MYNNLIYTLKKKIKVNIWKKVFDFIAADSTLRTCRLRCRRRPYNYVCTVVPSVRLDDFFRRCRFGSRFRLIFDIINQNLLLFTFTPHAKLLVRPNSLPVFVRVGRQSNRLPSYCRVLYVYIFFINHVSDNTNSITTHTNGAGIIRFRYKSVYAVRRRRRSRRLCFLYTTPKYTLIYSV
jgi:hypothetical protein